MITAVWLDFLCVCAWFEWFELNGMEGISREYRRENANANVTNA